MDSNKNTKSKQASVGLNDLLSTCFMLLKDTEIEIGHQCNIQIYTRNGDLIFRVTAWPKGKENINYGAELAFRYLDFADYRLEALFSHFKDRIKHELGKLK